MKVVILCGGEGIRLKDSPEFIAKAMVAIDDRPMVWHIMKHFALYGHTEFILALGKYADPIRNYFLNYDLYTNNIRIALGKNKTIIPLTRHTEENWTIDFVNTGAQAKTGARLFRCREYLDGKTFILSYADCLSDVNIDKLLAFHQKHKKTITITGVTPPYRYGEFILKNGTVVDYRDMAKLYAKTGSVNGGYMAVEPAIFSYLTSYNECVLEQEVFKKLAKKRELAVYEHTGFWQCLDNDREYDYITNLCNANKKYWLQ